MYKYGGKILIISICVLYLTTVGEAINCYNCSSVNHDHCPAEMSSQDEDIVPLVSCNSVRGSILCENKWSNRRESWDHKVLLFSRHGQLLWVHPTSRWPIGISFLCFHLLFRRMQRFHKYYCLCRIINICHCIPHFQVSVTQCTNG